MKRLTRMIIFSAVALYLTALWNGGFNVNFNPLVFIRTILLVSLFYYLIMPITKLVLLPINLLTLGLVSSLIYFLLFYFFFTRFSLVGIKPWEFQGLAFNGLSLKSMHIGYLTNVLLSSVSLSFIIRFLETIV